jgi:hypothetical protein
MRLTQEAERDEREPRGLTQPNLDRSLLGLLERMSSGLLSGIEQLAGKTGPRDPLGDRKTGGGDPTGGGSECVVIKNYPHFTGLQISGLNGKGKRRAAKGEPDFMLSASRLLFQGITSQMRPNSDDSDS